MSRRQEDDATFDGTLDGDDRFENAGRHAHGLLSKVFSSCSGDPKGSVHRAWGITLLFIAIFCVMAFVEVTTLNSNEGSMALKIASAWTAIIQFTMAILGTFILKRFPTSFSVGFFLGLVLIVAQQNLVLFGTFHNYAHGAVYSNHIFANLALSLFFMYGFFALILGHFRESILVSSADAKERARDDVTLEDGTSYAEMTR